MTKKSDQNHVSLAFWMFAIFVMSIPVVNIVMTILWAFTGQNETRKNYFKALIAWFLIGLVLLLAILTVGLSPVIISVFRSLRSSLGI